MSPGLRSGFGSGGSTAVKGLDYRFDVTGSQGMSFIDDTYSRLLNISGQLDYRITNDFRVWGAVEHKEDKDRFYWGTPLVWQMRLELSRPAELSQGRGPNITQAHPTSPDTLVR